MLVPWESPKSPLWVQDIRTFRGPAGEVPRTLCVGWVRIFTANETITNLTQYELSQEESDLLKAGLYFSIQPDKIRKSEIFTTFEKIHRSFINNLKSEETKSQIKAHLSYLANSYFYNYKPSPRILRQYRV